MKLARLMAVAMVTLAVLAGNAWAVIYLGGDEVASPYTMDAPETYISVDIRSIGGGTLNQIGGTITGNNLMRLGYGSQDPPGTSDIYNLSGGSCAAGDSNIGSDGGAFPAGCTATLAISGSGSYTSSGTVRLGDGGGANVTATLDVSGSGVFNHIAAAFQIGSENSYIKVTGGLAAITINAPYNPSRAIGGLTFTLNADGTKISPIAVTGGNFDLSNTGNSGRIHMALSGYTPTQGQVFDIISNPGGTILVPSGGAGANALLDPDDVSTWSLALADSDHKMQATYLPTQPPPPDAPSDLTATAVTSTRIDLEWTDNSDNEYGFKIERKTGVEGEWAQIDTVCAGVTTYQSTGLDPATEYYYRVRAYNGGGDSAYSNEANATTLAAPIAPSNLTALPVSDTQINLAWTDNSSDEDGFKIERKTGVAGEWGQIDTVGADVTTYPNTGLDPLTTYYYRVRAYNAAGNSDYSNEANATTEMPEGPGGLLGDYYDNIDFTNLKVTRIDPTIDFDWGTGSPDPSIGADTFSVRWTGQVKPLYSETYTFYTTTDEGVRLWVDNTLIVDKWFDQGPTEWSGTISLTAGIRYDIKIEYYENAGGAVAQLRWSSASQAKEIIPASQLYPTAEGAPSAPSDLTATAVSSSQIDLAWTDNSNNEDGFAIERKTGVAGEWGQIDTVGADVTTYPNTGLDPSTEYFYRVLAYNTIGDSAYSNEANATTHAPGADGTVRFYNLDGGGGETNYPSPYTMDSSHTADAVLLYVYGVVGSSTFSQTAGTLTNSGAFHLGYQEVAGTIITYNLSGGSCTSNGDTNVGTGFGLSSDGAHTLAVSGTGSYTGYGTARLGDGAAASAICTIDVSGSGSFVANSYVQFGDGNSYVKVTGGNATISLNHPWFGGDSGGGVYAVGGLKFILDANGSNISPIVCSSNVDLSNAGNAGVVNMALSGFTPTESQVFDIITATGTIFVPAGGANVLFNAGDVGTWSLALADSNHKLQATYLVPAPPDAPSNLTATTVSSSQIDLAWTDNSDNEDGFKIERKTGVAGEWGQIDTVGADVTTYPNTGLDPATEYYYRVRAYNGAGNSGYSNEDNATTEGEHIYNFVGITASDPDYNAYACDVDVFTFAGSSGNRNSQVEATDGQYVNISADNTAEWMTVDPKQNDEIFLWVEMKITEAVGDITQIDLTFNGNTDGGTTTHKIYVLKAGADWTQDASWVQVGSSLDIPADVDTEMTRSITTSISDYIDASGNITWGVYETRSSEDMRINYLEMKVTSAP